MTLKQGECRSILSVPLVEDTRGPSLLHHACCLLCSSLLPPALPVLSHKPLTPLNLAEFGRRCILVAHLRTDAVRASGSRRTFRRRVVCLLTNPRGHSCHDDHGTQQDLPWNSRVAGECSDHCSDFVHSLTPFCWLSHRRPIERTTSSCTSAIPARRCVRYI
jgi:hypothetical protein